MSTRVTGGARRERHVTKSEAKERLLAVYAIAKNQGRIVHYKHRLECSVSWYVMHMKYCKHEQRTCYCIQKGLGLGLGLGLAAELASLLGKYFTSYRKSSIKPVGRLIYFQQQQQQQQHLSGVFLGNISFSEHTDILRKTVVGCP